MKFYRGSLAVAAILTLPCLHNYDLPFTVHNHFWLPVCNQYILEPMLMKVPTHLPGPSLIIQRMEFEKQIEVSLYIFQLRILQVYIQIILFLFGTGF